MIDTDDLDRTLRRAFTDAGEHGIEATDPAPRVALRVARRRLRRAATRIATMFIVAAVAAATIGGLWSASTQKPAHFGPPPTAPVPAALLTPQAPADRAALTAFPRGDGALPSSVRWLATSLGVQLYGAIDHAGLPCLVIKILRHDGTSAASNCLRDRPAATQLRADVERFERQGTSSTVSESGEDEPHVSATGFLVPDEVKTIVIDHRHYPVTRNSVLLATNIGTVEREVRSGSTLYVVTK